MKQEDLMSYIYIGVREQRTRELIDQLATADHTQRSIKAYVKDVTLLTIMHKFLITQVLKKVVLQVVTYMLLEVKAKVKTITTKIEQNVKTVVIKLSHSTCRRTHPDRLRNNAEARHDPVSSLSSYL